MTNILKFNEKKHEYSVENKKLKSVTSFIKDFFTPFDVKTISKFVAKAETRKRGEKVTPGQIRKEWKAIAAEGSKIHNEIQFMLQNPFQPREVHLKAIQAHAFLQDNAINMLPLYAETQVYNKEMGLAGTIDCVARSGSNIILIDWKTNKTIRHTGGKCKHPVLEGLKDCNLTQYQLQLNIYAYILYKNFGLTVTDMYIVHLRTDSYTAYPVQNMYDTVKKMLGE